jgi:hypothetical protein
VLIFVSSTQLIEARTIHPSAHYRVSNNSCVGGFGKARINKLSIVANSFLRKASIIGGTSCTITRTNGGASGADGANGKPAIDGTDGANGGAFGTFKLARYSPSNGTTGQDNSTDGGGGGDGSGQLGTSKNTGGEGGGGGGGPSVDVVANGGTINTPADRANVFRLGAAGRGGLSGNGTVRAADGKRAPAHSF